MNSATLVFAMSDQIHLIGPGRCRQAIQPQIWATGPPSSSMPGAPTGAPQHGRSGGARTPHPRFWRPVLYQLSYTPKSNDLENRQAADLYNEIAPPIGAQGRGALVIADRNAMSSVAAPYFPRHRRRVPVGGSQPSAPRI